MLSPTKQHLSYLIKLPLQTTLYKADAIPDGYVFEMTIRDHENTPQSFGIHCFFYNMCSGNDELSFIAKLKGYIANVGKAIFILLNK